MSIRLSLAASVENFLSMVSSEIFYVASPEPRHVTGRSEGWSTKSSAIRELKLAGLQKP